MPRTILLISPYWRENHRWMVSSYKLAELWQRLGYRIVVACMGATSGKETVSPTLTLYRKRDVFLPDPLNFGIAPGFTGMVRRIIREERPDLIIVNKVLFWTSFSLIALRLTGHRVLLLTDALVGMTWWPRSLLPKCIMAAGAWTVGWAVLLCAKRVTFFHPQPERLLRFLGIAAKSGVIPTGIDPAPYAAARTPGNDVTVTYVGRLESVKGVDDFLAAAAPLVRPGVAVQVAGWYREGNPLVAAYQDRVRFLGLCDDIPGVLRSTDIFVLPSHSEGLSNALMEAMSSGCSCIASDVGGNRFLLQNGVSGFLFPAGDRAALRAHIERLLRDGAKRAAMGEAARQRIREHFSWDVVGKLYERLFDQLP